jgi:fructose-1,6-bisphosphatase/inositol monophosphatase family enzyme
VCAIERARVRAAVVVDQARGTRYEAIAGKGARCDGEPVSAGAVTELADAVVGLSGYPPRHLGWKQYRAMGAAALDLCAVAVGTLDAYIDCTHDAHGAWDYLGGWLVCREAGASVEDAHGRDLVVLDPSARRTPVAASTPELLRELIAARRSFD